MNKLITFILFAIATVNASASNGTVIPNGDIRASGTYFATPPNDARWSNETGESSVKAKYANFNGETFITLIAYHKEVEVALDYNVKVSKGQLTMVVVNSRDEVVFEKTFSEDTQNQVKITLEVYEEYKVKFIGKNTKGAYACRWTEQQANSNL